MKVRASVYFALPFSEFEERFTSRDIAILRAYDSLFLLGDKHNEALAASQQSLLFNIYRKADARPLSPNDFMLGHKHIEEISEEETIKRMKAALGKRD